MTLEESYRQGLNQFVHSDKERMQQQEELQKRSHKIRILEENVVYLEEIVRELKQQQVNADGSSPPSPVRRVKDQNHRNHDLRAPDDNASVADQATDPGLHSHSRHVSQRTMAGRNSPHSSTPEPDRGKRIVVIPNTRDAPQPRAATTLPHVGHHKRPTHGTITDPLGQKAMLPSTLGKFLRSKSAMS